MVPRSQDPYHHLSTGFQQTSVRHPSCATFDANPNGEFEFSFDANGEVVRRRKKKFRYDENGDVEQVTPVPDDEDDEGDGALAEEPGATAATASPRKGMNNNRGKQSKALSRRSTVGGGPPLAGVKVTPR